MPASDSSILKANLDAIRRRDPDLASRIEQASPTCLAWSQAKTGHAVASINQNNRTIALASRYDPLAEADKLVSSVEYQKIGCVVFMGLGLGYHVASMAEKMGKRGVMVVYEPDPGLWRAVLEQIDHTRWLGRTGTILADQSVTRPALTRRIEGYSAVVTTGMKLVTHPASRQLNNESFNTFGQMVMDILAFCRTNIATALVNSARTCRNLACNLAHYAAGATTNDLYQAAKGYPAVCLGAGPSLAKNIELLKDAGPRDKYILITVQTGLKLLLERGIRPDFVTALDYSQICTRFYEDLPPLPDVTLVFEPKGHPAILDNYPGPARLLASQFNDILLGPMAVPRIPMRMGCTVAHLSFYLAQHLGCDPIIFIGQDLGFSEGLYYMPGTAIHQVWSSELNQFNTTEMMEWRRIIRMRGHLRRETDVNGRPMFTDEQMITYLKQFERDFANAEQKIIDATEGGIPKAHTERMTLAEAFELFATRPVPNLAVPPIELDHDRLKQALELLIKRTDEINDLRATTKRTIPILTQMQKHHRDNAKMKKLFDKLTKEQHHVENDLSSAFALVNALNTIGAFKRNKADHAISYITDDKYQRQIQQLERDQENLDWLVQVCDEAIEICSEARSRLDIFLKKSKSATSGKKKAGIAAA